MPKISKEVLIRDKTRIYIKSAFKILRGLIKGFTLKRKKFPLFIGKRVELTHKSHIYVGKNVKFEAYSEIHGLSKYGLHFNDNVTIGRYTMIRPSSYYGVGNIGYGLTMGKNSSIGPFSFVGCSGKITIGKNVIIGPNVSLFAENHNFDKLEIPIKFQGVNNKGIEIEDNCWIGDGVIILDGVKIGHGSIIGAGTIVLRNIPSNSIVVDKRDQKIRSRIKK